MQPSSGLFSRIAPGIVALACCGALAAAAGAATLSLDLDQEAYETGDSITITLVGDAEGASALGIYGHLLFDTSLITWESSVQQPLTSLDGTFSWLRGAAGSPTQPFGVCLYQTSGCPVFDQIAGLTPLSPDNLLLSTVTFTAVAPGTVDLVWETDPVTGFQLNFFGLTNAAGISFTITGDPLFPPDPPPPPPPNDDPPPVYVPPPTSGDVAAVPEPSAALLFALGIACVRLRLRRSATA